MTGTLPPLKTSPLQLNKLKQWMTQILHPRNCSASTNTLSEQAAKGVSGDDNSDSKLLGSLSLGAQTHIVRVGMTIVTQSCQGHLVWVHGAASGEHVMPTQFQCFAPALHSSGNHRMQELCKEVSSQNQ